MVGGGGCRYLLVNDFYEVLYRYIHLKNIRFILVSTKIGFVNLVIKIISILRLFKTKRDKSQERN